MIDVARRIGPRTTAEITQDAFDRWNSRTDRRARTYHVYVTKCSPPLRTSFVNSHGETLYYRPQTIFGSRWFARHSTLHDYRFQVASAQAPTALPGNETEAPTPISATPASEENGVRIR